MQYRDQDSTKGQQTDNLTRPATNEILQAEKSTPDSKSADEPYSIYSQKTKTFLIISVSFMAIISPLSSAVYLPAVPQIGHDLNVSPSLINLTITTYMIFQGIAPSFIGTFSDTYGRRPAYVICGIIYLAANIGLALNNTYAGLLVLRCIQSCGSSATIALGSATVADLVTRAERGKFIGYAGMGVTLGPAIGPVAGGLITENLGWRALFWFLAILSGVLFLLILVFLPETCRSVVGNGSIPCPWWNMSLLAYIQHRKNRLGSTSEKPAARKKRPNPFAALKILLHRESGIILGFGSLMYAGYFSILTTLSNELSVRFGYSPVIIGLCYLPIGVGSITTRWTVGYLIDRNFRRHAAKAGYEFTANRQQDMSQLNLERARLEVSLPLIYLSAGVALAYGWTMESKSSLAGIEVALFFIGMLFTGALNGLNVLVVDINSDTPATAVAANNLFRCLVSAGAVAIATPMINRIGMGWMGVFIAGLWVLFSPCIWLIMLYGYKWRLSKGHKEEC
ncbi:hypothetical protein TRIATDRAFT_33216 [Trichoderma atroviride IMI 206040]|uniref:Major facilitator superfamily (MFS) profile domain-containing protein n=1 Tax=Hypocrea atroviridis (strain ATCC 20476 / IMI 206040) TaxID=452589 RepID=G9P0T7_HYPAI|nr:uncharacterized protein TRIATDRAFT_33216 [Trichoderma atroviride IMI 206040]EHK42404.1 hypothetical protein TRIATDRAFT_33216 [Trichoderma atroviride IMI 206040]